MGKNQLIKILFLAADPKNTTRLRLGQEIREIREKLQMSQNRNAFVLESRESVRVPDITQAIHDVQPHIIHFSGHGSNTGELYFEDFQGDAYPVRSESLADLFALLSDQVICVVLNACYSEHQAKAISRHIPCVIGMNQAIGDYAAITFSSGFYKALGANKSVDQAFKFGCVELQLLGIPEHLTPTIITHPNQATFEKLPLKTESELSSDKFSKLEELLTAASRGNEQAWREADDETRSLILKIAKPQHKGYLDPASFKKIPCQDLRTINRLWIRYSNNRFGFSIQQKIYLECGGKTDGKFYDDAWQKFALRVGWKNRRNWIRDSDVIYSQSAPVGHLPTGKGMGALGVNGWWPRLVYIAARARCNLES